MRIIMFRLKYLTSYHEEGIIILKVQVIIVTVKRSLVVNPNLERVILYVSMDVVAILVQCHT